LQDFKLSEEEAYTELARRFFAWIGPATMVEFQKFSGLGVKASKVAVEPLKLEPLAPGDDRLLAPGDRAELEAFKPPRDPHYVLLAGIDSAILLRKNLEWLLDPKDLGREVYVKRGFKPIGELQHFRLRCSGITRLRSSATNEHEYSRMADTQDQDRDSCSFVFIRG
jgi:hypothetical protein